MRTPLFLIAVALLAACSEEAAPPESAETAPAAEAAAKQQAGTKAAATEKADMAAAEATSDPCDLSGYDMSKMTVEQHEQLVKVCAQSKQ